MYRSQRESLEKELSELNDEELVKRCVETMSPDSIAYQILINRYQRIIRGTCMNILMNEEDAEEVAQDTYIRLYFKLH